MTEQINALAAPRDEGDYTSRAVHAVVHQGAGRGGRDDVRPAARRRALQGRPDGHRGLPGARAASGGEGADPTAPHGRGWRRGEPLRRAARGRRRLGVHRWSIRSCAGSATARWRTRTFRFYVRQDYLFLIDYGPPARAWARARAPRRLTGCAASPALREAVLETEMDLHARFAAPGGSRPTLEATESEPARAATAGTRLPAATARWATSPSWSRRCCRACGATRRSDAAGRAGRRRGRPGYAEWIAMYARATSSASSLACRELTDAAAASVAGRSRRACTQPSGARASRPRPSARGDAALKPRAIGAVLGDGDALGEALVVQPLVQVGARPSGQWLIASRWTATTRAPARGGRRRRRRRRS